MHFWRKDYFESLRELTADAIRFPEWSDYFAYCEHLERGLRREALSKLDGFVSSLLATSFDERRRFVSWLYKRVWTPGGSIPSFLIRYTRGSPSRRYASGPSASRTQQSRIAGSARLSISDGPWRSTRRMKSHARDLYAASSAGLTTRRMSCRQATWVTTRWKTCPT